MAVEQIAQSGRIEQWLDAMSTDGLRRWSANNRLIALLQLHEVADMLATPGMCLAASRTSIGRSSALLGMHAQYEHSPPISSCSTMTAVRSLPWIAY